MDETIPKNILDELRTIKKLLAHNLLTGDTQTKQISELDSIGLQPKEIADILGTTSNTVNVALNRTRKGKSKRSLKK
jgi:DNA-directed RNA polymerase specialized sigma24 family protein